jgi:hypothetical protein
MAESEHEVMTALRDDETWGLTCKCGWTSVASSEVYTDAIARRHYLVKEIWPFEEDDMPENWPHNE